LVYRYCSNDVFYLNVYVLVSEISEIFLVQLFMRIYCLGCNSPTLLPRIFKTFKGFKSFVQAIRSKHTSGSFRLEHVQHILYDFEPGELCDTLVLHYNKGLCVFKQSLFAEDRGEVYIGACRYRGSALVYPHRG